MIALLFLGAPATHASGIPADAPNCSVTTPPPEAGETAVNGALVKVHPRRSGMTRPFAGCQTSWLLHEGRWVKVSVLYFERGELRAWWQPDREAPSRAVLCTYSRGKLDAGAHPQCHVPARESAPAVSYAPGCVQEAMRTGRLTSRCFASSDHMH